MLFEMRHTFGGNELSGAELRYDSRRDDSPRFLARIVSISARDLPMDKMQSCFISLILTIAMQTILNDFSLRMEHHVKHEPSFSKNSSSLDVIEHFHSVLPDDPLKAFLPQRC